MSCLLQGHPGAPLGRRGKSLLEMLVVLSVMSVVLGANTLVLWALFRIERQMSLDLAQRSGHARLSQQWRADAHAAVSAESKGDCQFALADGSAVRYWVDGQRLRREVSKASSVEHRDSFELATGTIASFEVTKQDERTMARLKIVDAGKPPAFAPMVRPLELAALVDLHQASRPIAASPGPSESAGATPEDQP